MNFELTILGSSSAIPTSERYPTAQVLNVLERFFLIDCGEGTQIQLRRLKINFAKISHICISHLHGDHYYGLIGFISTRNLLGINNDLHIYAHSELKNLLQPQIDYLKADLQFKIIFHPLNFRKPELIFSDNRAEILSFPLKHSVPVCGFLFREKVQLPHMRKEKIAEYQIPLRQIQTIKEGAGFTTESGAVIPHSELTTPAAPPRSYAFCTDTAYFEPAAEIIRGVDLLYHEATFLDEMAGWAAQTYHST
ncbi:MAG TPA: ribonuclease Z, partial [Prolixibacteraceae bacterium]|nr:ribonuclease Z [Prolixibacteraceae bacterium]